MESTYTAICKNQGIKPNTHVLQALVDESSVLRLSGELSPLVSPKQTDNDFFVIGILLKQSPVFIEELSIAAATVSECALEYLSEGLEGNKSLRKISLSRLSLNSTKGIAKLLLAVQECFALEELIMEDSELDDDFGAYIACLIESNYPLRSLVLDNNKFKDFSFALSLAKNQQLLSFTLNNNPLDFTNQLSLLEMLTINKTLQHLGISGMDSKSPAPIKENPSGLLTVNEAVALKLANVLRHSTLASISINLDPSCFMQLKELEISLSKHNRTLVQLSSSLINWSNTAGVLSNIYKALQANLWLSDRTQDLPRDLEDLICAKLSRKDQNESFKSSPNKTPHKPALHKDLTESKHSDTTVVENKNIKEMSFGKATIDKYLRQDDSLNKFIQSINGKMSDLEEKFNLYTNKTDLCMERIEQKVTESRRSEDLTALTASVQEIQARLEQFESDKFNQQSVVEEYIQKLEALKFKESSAPSKRSSRRLRAQQFDRESFDSSRIPSLNDTGQSVYSDSLKVRIVALEQKIDKFEGESAKIDEFGKRLKGTMGKVARLEGAVQDIVYTPKKQVEIQNTQKGKETLISLPGDAESVVISALLEKATKVKVDESFYRSRNMSNSEKAKREPSAELKQCLRSRGFTLEGDRPVFRRYKLD